MQERGSKRPLLNGKRPKMVTRNRQRHLRGHPPAVRDSQVSNHSLRPSPATPTCWGAAGSRGWCQRLAAALTEGQKKQPKEKTLQDSRTPKHTDSSCITLSFLFMGKPHCATVVFPPWSSWIKLLSTTLLFELTCYCLQNDKVEGLNPKSGSSS